MQLTHYTSQFKKKQHPITIVCDNISNAPNIGSIFRIADAFSVEELIFCGDTNPIGKRMTKTSRSTEKYVKYRLESSIINVIEDLKNEHHFIIGLEITNKSIPLNEFKLTSKEKIVLVLGDENFGISETVLNNCDAVVHINMFGNNSSMNVVQATSIALYELTRQLNS